MKKKSNEESVNFIKSIETLLKNDEGFAEEYLTSRGYDPKDIGLETENFAQKMIIQKQAKFVKKELDSKLERAKTFLKKLHSTSESGINKIQDLLSPKLVQKYAINFRDLKQMKESDAINILTNIEILEFLEKEYGNDDSKNKG